MRGFLRRTPVPTFRQIIQQHSPPLPGEPVPLVEALGRVLAQPVVARQDVPHFDRAAMDGYALRGEETFGAGPYHPVPFHIVGEALPGRPYPKAISSGEAVRVMTGAPIPEGADAVLMAEAAQSSGEWMDALEDVPPLRHVSRVGEDVRTGTPLLPSGRVLRPADLGLLAAQGMDHALVLQKPTVEVLVTGSELCLPDQAPEDHRIFDSDSVMLQALIQRDGGHLLRIQHLPDDREAWKAALARISADVVLITGGTSVGTEDHGPSLLSELGELLVHGIPLRPAAPTGFGLLERSRVFLLPGNPAACFCAYDCFVREALCAMGGRPLEWPYRTQNVRLRTKLSSQVGRMEYIRVRIEGAEAQVLASGGASILSSLTRADGFLLTDEASEGFEAGAAVTVWRYD
jgi:molybdopterin molybdotransferase